MGGAESLRGTPITLRDVERAVVVDCAGDLSAGYRDAAALYVPRVILDIESRPFALARLEALAGDLADTITGGASSPLLPERPERVYVLCQHGMNRSGLMAGLLLRALGESGDEIVDLIRRLRPGSLSNHTFVSLIREWEPLRPATR